MGQGNSDHTLNPSIRLTGQLYLIGVGLILVPLVVMEIAKAFGLTHHQPKEK